MPPAQALPLRQLATRLTPRGWITLAASMAVAIIGAYTFLHMVSKPSYATLATGIEPAQTGKMTSVLDQHGIHYELQNNGTALAVQSNETAQARVALAGSGLLGNAQPGFSLFEKSSLGESNFQQQVTYQRALQGQLAQTIDDVQGVSGAQVELVLPDPQSQVFGETQTAASAAVLLSGTTSLDPSSVRGIAQLVSSSVPGLQLNKVTITDGSGQLLWPAESGEDSTSATGKQAAEERYDSSTEAKLDTILAQTLGAGKAEVQVNASLNTNQTTQESTTYGKSVPLQQTKNIETLAGNGTGAAAAGTANVPAAAQTGSGKSNYKHEVTSSTLAAERTVTHSTIAPGAIESQHVSVLLDKSVPASSVPAIKEAITNAAGIQAKRGDTISIGQMSFAKPAATAEAASSPLGYAKYALIGIASALFLFFTTRSLRRREKEPIDHQPAWLRELELPVPLAELERQIPTLPTQPMPVLTSNGGNPVRRQVEQLAEANPDRVAQQLRSWMQED
ncbi:MAG TPA: flagellar basal-body MS-ring/collar protein FliF [Solirubrobacteraceae bacterium]|nr:flagellar basal-body MS-ring/collar protein FliF [Solirubrobacteraceae bacterium]